MPEIRFRPKDRNSFRIGDEVGQLWEGEVPITLRPKQWQLLRYLAERPGKAIAKRELLDNIWGADVAVQPQIIDQTLAGLRQRLGDKAKGSRFIETVSGGLKFVADVESQPSTNFGHLPDRIGVTLKSFEQDFFDDVYEHDARDNARRRSDDEKDRLLGEYRALLSGKFGPRNVSLKYSTVDFPGGSIRIDRKEDLRSLGHESAVWLEVNISLSFDDLETLHLLQDRKLERWRKAVKSAFRFRDALDLDEVAQHLYDRGIQLAEYGEGQLAVDIKDGTGTKAILRCTRVGAELELLGYEVEITNVRVILAGLFKLFGLDDGLRVGDEPVMGQ